MSSASEMQPLGSTASSPRSYFSPPLSPPSPSSTPPSTPRSPPPRASRSRSPSSPSSADASLDSLLESLDLQKYSVNFQAEEVDMKALVHMNEEDMKSLGIPMGPRKKILSALASKKMKSSRSLPTS